MFSHAGSSKNKENSLVHTTWKYSMCLFSPSSKGLAEWYRRLRIDAVIAYCGALEGDDETKSHFQPALIQAEQAGLASSHFLCLVLQ